MTFADNALAQVAACLAEPARARMLCCLMDGHARTATELATVAEVGASTASAHLARLTGAGLLAYSAQGRHRYYSLAGPQVAAAVESLLVLAGQPLPRFVPSTPEPLREARRCYDHLAGNWSVSLHDLALQQAWVLPSGDGKAYELTEAGQHALTVLGVDLPAARQARRRYFACSCMDWSERRPHLGGALGAAWLQALLTQAWLEPVLDSRALRPTGKGRRALAALLVKSRPGDEAL